MSWFKKILPSIGFKDFDKKGVPEGLWSKCDSCGSFLFNKELERNLHVCTRCNHHFRIPARKRLELFLDATSKTEIAKNIKPVDKLKFKDSKKYKDRLSSAQRATGEKDALVVMQGKLKSNPIVACAFEFAFIGGSMGSVVGEKFVRAINCSIENNAPFVCFSASGGARMQESLISLMQMSKTSAALAKLAKAKLPFISVLTDPCMGGVSASLAMLGDVIIAEPKALIGFAGPKVIEQTVRETLPEGFQRSEFLLEKGFVDMIVGRSELRDKISNLIEYMNINNG